jgi:transcriptional regulator with XRE-family HTH domain
MKPNVGDNLKRFREEKGLTQEQMAKLLGYSLSGYRKIEQGNRGLPIPKALKTAEILKCSLNEIFLPF